MIERLRSEHTESAVRERLAEVRPPEYLRDFYGDDAVGGFCVRGGHLQILGGAKCDHSVLEETLAEHPAHLGRRRRMGAGG